MSAFFQGMLVFGALIIAIGGQNAFVLRQGLLNNHIFWVALICFICDVTLMSIGILGLGTWIAENAYATIILGVAGALFLFFYGLRSFYSAFTVHHSLIADQENRPKTSLKTTIIATLAITLLNPHVYLDTVLLVGTYASKLPDLTNRFEFMAGACLISFSWFFMLGFGARLLTPLFSNLLAWRILEFMIGLIMWWIAYGLAIMVYQAFPQ